MEKIAGFSLAAVPFKNFNYIIYSDIYPASASNPTLVIDSTNVANVQSIISMAHAAGCKVLASLADNPAPTFDTIIESPSLLAAFISNIAAFVKQYGFDGVSTDWEQSTWTADHQTKMSNLISGLRAALPTAIINMYSYQSARTDCTVNAAESLNFIVLGLGPDLAAQEAQLKYWVSQGIPASKIIPIIPEYGQGVSGGQLTGGMVCSWADIVRIIAPASGANSENITSIPSTIGASPATVPGGVLAWAGPEYIQSLIAFVKANGFAGAGLYEESFDVQGVNNSMAYTAYAAMIE